MSTDRAVKTLEVSTGYTPRKMQDYIHRHLKRFNVLVIHRRAGKTVLSINEMVDQGMKCPNKNPQIAYIAPTYGMAKRIAWDYLKEAVKGYPFLSIHEHELRIDLQRPDRGDRVRLMLLGADNINALRGIYLDLAVLDEYGEMNPEIWTHVVRPALSDREGGAIFIGTVKGKNHFYDMYEFARKDETGRWFCAMFKASETGILPKLELDEAKATMGEEAYNQEYECDWASALVGAYFSKEMQNAEKEGRIRELSYNPSFPVNTYWDLGISDAMAIWFVQRIGGKNYFIDYHEDSGPALDHYVHVLQEKGYVYGTHELPHDGNIRDIGSGETRREVLYRLGVKNVVVQKKHLKRDSIDAARRMLPISVFDSVRCAKGIDGLKSYRRKWDAERKVFNSEPIHDWSSHSSDAFMCAAMSNTKYLTEGVVRPTLCITEYDPFER